MSSFGISFFNIVIFEIAPSLINPFDSIKVYILKNCSPLTNISSNFSFLNLQINSLSLIVISSILL